jgi:hypothetical protein
MTRTLVCSLLVALIAFGPGIRAQQPPAAAEPPSEAAATNDEIARWIEQLDADEFLEREDATEKLVLAGTRVIHPLLAAMQAQSRPELNIRAVYVFKQLALADDGNIEETARQALEKVASLRMGTATQKANETLAALSVIRQQRAFEALVKLGAKTEPDNIHQVEYLEWLEIGEQWKGSDEDLGRLQWLPNVSRIRLRGDKVNDKWLEYAARVPNLVILEVNRATISAQGIANLRNAASLRLVEVRYAPLADDAVEQLMTLTAATHMKLYGTQITPAAAERLQKALPTTIIDVRAGAFLGIGGDVHSLGVIILDVRDDTSAQSAGLLQGDVIVRYEGQRVEDFTGLTALIAKNLPKDVVTIQYVRNPEPRVATRVRSEKNQTLGIQGEAHVIGCKIAKVEENSLASELGLRAGEVIFRLNDTAVENPEHLEQLFAAIPLGEAVVLEFAPRLDVRSAKVTLGEWN